MRRQAESKTDEVSKFEAQLEQRVQEALAAKHAFVAAGEREQVQRREQLRATEDAIARARDELEGLRMYKAVGHQELGRQLALLHRTVDDMRADHAATVREMNERFNRARARFAENVDIRLERTKEAASETALARHRTRDVAEHADSRWLEMELATHAAELGRLEECCLRLEQENLSLLARLSGGEYGTGRWASLETYKRQGEMARGLRIGAEDDDGEGEGDESGESGESGESEDDDDDEDEDEEEEEEEEEDEETIGEHGEGTAKAEAAALSAVIRDSLVELNDGADGADGASARRRSSKKNSRRSSSFKGARSSRVSFAVPAAEEEGEEEGGPAALLERKRWRLSQSGTPFLATERPDEETVRLLERQRRASGLKGVFKTLAMSGEVPPVAKRPSVALVEEAETAQREAAMPRASMVSLLQESGTEQRRSRASEPSIMASIVVAQASKRMSRGGGNYGGGGGGGAKGAAADASLRMSTQLSEGVGRLSLGGQAGGGARGASMNASSLRPRRSTTTSFTTTTALTSPALPPARQLRGQEQRRTSLPPLRGALNASF